MSAEPALGLYVHVPFCSAICNYCNFNRGVFDPVLKASFVDALLQEIQAAGTGEPADTIYFGGGTPSLLAPEEIAAVIRGLRGSFALTDDAEVTLEANPDSADRQRLEGFGRAGINRLSFGVQSFRDDELRMLDRLHSASCASDALALARATGFDNVSLDLMMWLPGQTPARWMESVEQAIHHSPDHVSLYMLEVYPHLPLRAEMDRRGWQQLSDDVAADMYEAAMTSFEAGGYRQYEISNVARAGKRSRHNLKYWSDGRWLGFGPGAHSTTDRFRWRNVSSTEDYVQRITDGVPVAVDHRERSTAERLGDALFTGLRLNDGLELSSLSATYQIDVWRVYGARLTPYLEAGLLQKAGDRMWLTRRGMLMAHEVMAIFV